MPNNPNAVDNLTPIKKGEVRNPKGRPKGARSFKTVIRELLENYEEIIEENGNKKKIDGYDKVTLQLFKKAVVDNDLGAMREIIDRLEGKSAQAVDVTSKGESLNTDARKLDETIAELTKQVNGNTSGNQP